MKLLYSPLSIDVQAVQSTEVITSSTPLPPGPSGTVDPTQTPTDHDNGYVDMEDFL